MESNSSVGDKVRLTINRNGAIKDLDVLLDALPSPEKLQNVAAEQSSPNLGLQLCNGGDSMQPMNYLSFS